MPASTLSVFSEPDDFQAALKEGGWVDFLVTGRGKFLAHLSRIALHRVRLASGDERQSRVAFISIPHRLMRITLPVRPAASLLWGGVGIRPDEIVTHSAGHRTHERTNGPCRWSSLWFLMTDLSASGRAMTGATFALARGQCRWRPTPEALRCLTSLHGDAVRATAAHPSLPVDAEAARGLEQQLLEAVIECLVGEPTDQGNLQRRQHAEIMTRFEDVIRASPVGTPSLAEIRAALGVSENTLWMCCRAHLGMTPSRYLYLRRMRLANRALRGADDTETTVAQVARLHGFDCRGGFPSAYRMLFGELPSATLRRRTV
jgi:AraC-like DNA-binding protein